MPIVHVVTKTGADIDIIGFCSSRFLASHAVIFRGDWVTLPPREVLSPSQPLFGLVTQGEGARYAGCAVYCLAWALSSSADQQPDFFRCHFVNVWFMLHVLKENSFG